MEGSISVTVLKQTTDGMATYDLSSDPEMRFIEPYMRVSLEFFHTYRHFVIYAYKNFF